MCWWRRTSLSWLQTKNKSWRIAGELNRVLSLPHVIMLICTPKQKLKNCWWIEQGPVSPTSADGTALASADCKPKQKLKNCWWIEQAPVSPTCNNSADCTPKQQLKNCWWTEQGPVSPTSADDNAPALADRRTSYKSKLQSLKVEIHRSKVEGQNSSVQLHKLSTFAGLQLIQNVERGVNYQVNAWSTWLMHDYCLATCDGW